MSAIRVEVDPVILRWVISRIPSGSVTDRILESLHAWLKGEKKPTLRQLEEVSRKTYIPFGYFFLDTPPREDFLFAGHGTPGSGSVRNPSRNLMDVVDAMQDVQEWMTEYRRLNDMDPPVSAGRFTAGSSVGEIAQDIRKVLDLETDWFARFRSSRKTFDCFRRKLEDSGSLVMQSGIVGSNTGRKLDLSEFRAFCLNDGMTPLIFLNSRDSDEGKMYSLALETAHIWTGGKDFFGGEESSWTRKETLCGRTASELLVPETLFRTEWAKVKDRKEEEKFQILSGVFRCGADVIAGKAYDPEHASGERHAEIPAPARKDVLPGKNRRNPEKGNHRAARQPRLSRPFLLALAQSVGEGRTLYRDAYRLTGTGGKSFHRLLEKLR